LKNGDSARERYFRFWVIWLAVSEILLGRPRRLHKDEKSDGADIVGGLGNDPQIHRRRCLVEHPELHL
jgi:hypothetical protein